MKEPSRFFNFQMPYKKYEKLEAISKQNDCSIAEIVRQAINLLLDKLNGSCERRDD
ncbi:transcriptional regulator [Candidatus Scalindua japonica]|uniref:Transcriptional regulator n=1 Tax=Candidatus Scalindua japonica TaxID=1284222 RepID=A0A286TVM4_9BACT|nr:ribbon-helix-helix domain-containing protein [Candidatus Scalindua japonica]GAX59895.1 transcriptional regulator [Candidatus Scalindua japonica]